MATSPINITKNYDNVCNLKCDYQFNYPLSNLIITNKGGYVYMTIVDSGNNKNSPSVIYNAENYQVKEIRMFRKSLHTFSGNNADAEIIIVHKSITGNSLLVCVPIMIGNTTNSDKPEAKGIFDSIISEMSKTANSVGQKTTLNIPTLTLNKLIPEKSFFSYSGTLPFSPSNGDNDIIVFNKDNALNINQKTFNIFSQLISESNEQIQKVNNLGLFFNQNGASTISNNIGGNDIYIECLPTGASGEVLVKKEPHATKLFDVSEIKSILNNPILISFFGVFVVVGVMYGGKIIINKISTPSSE